VIEPGTGAPGAADGVMRGPFGVVGGLVLVLLAALALREVASLVVPVLFGLFLALVAAPLIGALERRGMAHGIALAGAIGIVLAVVVLALGLVALSVAQLIAILPTYEGRVGTIADDLQAFLAGFGVDVDPSALPGVITPGMLATFAQSAAAALSRTAGSILVLAFTLVFALSGAAATRARAEVAFGADHALLSGVMHFGDDLRRYLVVRAQLGVFAAVLVFALLVVLSVPLPLLWAFLVFAASFVPNVGTIVALVPPTILAVLDSGFAAGVAVVVGFTLINVAQDYLLQPRLIGTELNLSPLVVFLSIVVWAWILGAAGALLAVPLTVGLVGVLEAFPASRPAAALMRNSIEPQPGLVADAAAVGRAAAAASDEVGRPDAP
jgi:AI-2 transport protein TqsA